MNLAMSIIAFGIFFSSLFSLIGALGFLFIKPPVRSLYTSIYLFMFFFWLLLAGFGSLGLQHLIPFNLLNVGLIFYSVAIPFCTFDLRKKIDSSFHIGWKQLLHFTGILFAVLYTVLFYRENGHIHFTLTYKEMYYDPPGCAFFSIALYFPFIFFLIEMGICLYLVRMFPRNNPDEKSLFKFSRRIIYLDIIQSFLWIIDRAFSLEFIFVLYFISGFFILYCFFSVLRNFANEINIANQKLEQANIQSVLKNLDEAKIKEKIEDLIYKEKIYRNDDISLDRFAEEASITPKQLSVFIKINYKKNFSSFINSFRIDEAKKKLLDNPDLLVIDIAYEVGFNSSSSFFRVFKQELGMSPSEYRNCKLCRSSR